MRIIERGNGYRVVRTIASGVLATLMVLLVVGVGKAAPSALLTVPGPESKTLIPSTTGYLVYTDLKSLHVLALPGLSETTLKDPSMENGITVNIGQMPTIIDAVSGPDRNGRIAYLESQGRHQLLKITKLDSGRHETIFSRPGEDLLEGIGSHALALAPDGGHVATFGQCTGIQMHKPDALLFQGPLEIWNPSTREKLIGDDQALQYGGLSWSQDGQQLAYVKLVPRDQAPTPTPGSDNFASSFSRWDKVPVTFVENLAKHESLALSVGWHPVVSTDGGSVVLFDYDDKARLVDLKTRESKPLEWKGHWHGIISFTAPSHIIYLGLPTSGDVARWTEHYSPLVGPKQLVSVKVSDLLTGDFQTVMSYFDWRHSISYGGQR